MPKSGPSGQIQMAFVYPTGFGTRLSMESFQIAVLRSWFCSERYEGLEGGVSAQALGEGFSRKWKDCVPWHGKIPDPACVLGNVTCFFSGTGTNKDLLDKLTDEAKNVMATADSVLTSVTDGIQQGNILVKHLEEVFQHQEQFIGIWETSKRGVQKGMVGLGHHCSDAGLLRRGWECSGGAAGVGSAQEGLGVLCRSWECCPLAGAGSSQSQFVLSLQGL